jgi:hypothetical protein
LSFANCTCKSSKNCFPIAKNNCFRVYPKSQGERLSLILAHYQKLMVQSFNPQSKVLQTTLSDLFQCYLSGISQTPCQELLHSAENSALTVMLWRQSLRTSAKSTFRTVFIHKFSKLFINSASKVPKWKTGSFANKTAEYWIGLK